MESTDTKKVIVNRLREVGDMFATIRGIMRKPVHPETTKRDPKIRVTGDLWVEMLRDVDLRHFGDCVDEILDGKWTLSVPREYTADELAARIRRECDRRLREEERRANMRSPFDPKASRGAWDFVKQKQVGRIAIDLGNRDDWKALPRDEQEERLTELFEWEKGAARPHWLDAALTDESASA